VALPEVYRVVLGFRAALVAREAAQMALMAQRWLPVQDALRKQIEDLAQSMAGKTFVSEAQLMRMERYQNLLAQVRREIAQYNGWAEDRIEDEQRAMAWLGQRHAGAALDAWQTGVRFDVLNPAAVEAMVGVTQSGAPVAELLRLAWPDAVEGITKALVTGLAMGQNPRKTAREMAKGLNGALDRMLRIARTEQLRAYRASTQERFRQSGVIVGYRRLCAKQERTCIACLVDDGHFYEVATDFSDHMNGRCAITPILAGHEDDKVPRQTGQEWFEKQDEAAQQRIMGKAKWEAWRNKEFELGDLVKWTENDTWGPSIGAKSLKDVIAGKES